jgi:hypothetical protein
MGICRKLRSVAFSGSVELKCDKLIECVKQLSKLSPEPQHTLPDVFIWLTAGGKRLAFCRVPAQTLIW